MRLLRFDETGNLSLTDPLNDDETAIPPYAVLSHTWGKDQDEVSLEDIKSGSGREKAGYAKILFCGQQAVQHGIKHFWVDTCCIDQRNLAELSEAFNSMFQWYQNAKVCYVYLADFSVGDTEAWQHNVARLTAFRKCRWFTRGWCLQELIAPQDVKFYSVDRVFLGDKSSLGKYIHEITGIPIAALQGRPLAKFSAEEKMSWAKGRETKRKEDKAYCLLGIFGVFMAPIYGEGEHAFKRLQAEVSARNLHGSESVLLPMSTVPFRKDFDFVDRVALCEELDEKCGREAARVALVGIGGVGKSQLAIAYCYRLRSRRPDIRVFWIYASSVDRVEQGFRELAEVVDLPGRNDPHVDLFELVRKYLRNESIRPWLVVLDGLDTAKALDLAPRGSSKQAGQYLLDYLPASPVGHILVTTRTTNVAIKIVDYDDIIEVKTMTEIEASQLLTRKLQYPSVAPEPGEIGELAKILDFMPLALVQGAAFIRQRGSRCTVRQYIDQYKKGDQQRLNLLGDEAGHLRRDRGALSSINTWHISFDHIRDQHPASADLLSLMSFCDGQSIPETLLRSHRYSPTAPDMFEGGIDHARNTDNFAFDAVLQPLRDFMLVTVEEDGQNFTMHGLVQLGVRNWLAKKGKAEYWRQIFLSNLNNAYPSADFENWTECEALLPHVKRAEEQPPDHESSSPLILAWAAIMRNAGSYRMVRGRYEEAERLCQASSEKLEHAFGREHLDTMKSMAKVAEVYRERDLLAEAEKRFLTVLHNASNLMAPDDQDILATKVELARTYNRQARPDDALRLLRPTLETVTRKLGPEDPLTLKTMASLAVSHWHNAHYNEAEKLEVDVMSATLKTHGMEHPDTLMSMSALASTLRDQGRWKEAENLETEVLQIREKLLGLDHSDTLESMSDLAVTLWYQGRLEESEKLEVRVLEGTSRVLGKEHTTTLACQTNLAATYRDQEKWDDAEDLLTQVVETLTRASGSRHPRTLNAQINLAATWRDHGHLEQAKDLATKVLDMHQKERKPDHPDTLSSMTTLQTILHLQGVYDQSEQLGLEVLSTRKKTLGDRHPDTLVSMANLARTFKEQGRHDEALELMSFCQSMSEEILGLDHTQTRKVLETLAVWLAPEDEFATLKVPGAWVD